MSATPEVRPFDLSLLASLASRDQLCGRPPVAPYSSLLAVDARYAQ